MAYYRNISMAFWTDNKVQDEFTPEDKYFYLYLLTNPQTNLCGCYEISFKEIERETGYNRETINKLLFRFQYILNVIAFNEENKEVFLLNWHKYNLSTSEKTISGARKVVAYVKTEEFRNELNYLLDCYETKEPYICRINGAYMGHTYPTQASVSVSVSDTVSESDKDLENSKDIDVVKNDNENERYVHDSYHDSSKDSKHRKETPVRHKYGQYKNVLLSDEDMEKLQNEFPFDWQERVENVSEYCKSKGKTYSDYLATIRSWARKEKKQNKVSGGRDLLKELWES